MEESEQLQYLTNVLSIAHSDDELAASEERQIECIRVAISAKKSVLNKARKHLSTSTPSLESIERFSDRMRCLEDMIECALADNDLSGDERLLIANLARQTSISQDQIDLLLRESKQRQSSLSPCCPCGQKDIPSGAKFCPSCGADLADQPAQESKQLDISPSSQGLTVAFAHSTAGSFGDAIRAAKKSASFQQAERNGKRWYAASYGAQQIGEAIQLANHVGSIRSKEVYIDGVLADWRETFAFASCSTARDNAYNPVEHCFGLEDDRFNVWGCKEMRLPWVGWSDLFACGRFKNSTTLIFDRDRIAHEIQEAIKGVRLCPHLRVAFIAEVLRTFPKEAKVGPRTGWQYKETYSPDPRSIKLTLIDRSGGFEWKREINAIGVQPSDTSAALDMIKTALKRCNHPEIKPVLLKLR